MSAISWQGAIKSACAAVIFFCTGVIIWTVGPTLETRLFPVVGKLAILRIEALPDGRLAVYAAFRKLRACDYIGIAWYRGVQAGSFERVPIALLRERGDVSSPNRPVGFQTSGPWQVAIPPDQIRNNSFVELFHRCHPFWVTRTEFYP